MGMATLVADTSIVIGLTMVAFGLWRNWQWRGLR
jgi:hypothetical protein